MAEPRAIDQRPDDALEEMLGAFVEKVRAPGAAGGVLDADGRLDAAASGSCRRGGDRPVSLDHAWHIGSCAKAITAALWGRLVEAGLAEWRMPVADAFADQRAALHPGWAERTVEELLLCTSGLRGNVPMRDMPRHWADDRPMVEQRSELVSRYLAVAPRKPGRFLYSNLGYTLVGAAVDRLAYPYEQALRQYLFDPLGMDSVGFGPPPDVLGHGPRLRAGPLGLGRGRPAEPDDVRSDNPPVYAPAGTLHMTLGDWARFVSCFLGEPTLLTEETVAALFGAPPGSVMAKGWGFAKLPGVSFGAQGSNTMWSATALLNEDRSRAALVLVNDGRSRVLAQSANLALAMLESR